MSLTTVIHQFVTLFNRSVILTLFINHAVWFLYISRPGTPSSRFCVQTSRVSTFILSLSKLILRSQGGQQFTNQAYFNNFKFGLEVSFGRENPFFFFGFLYTELFLSRRFEYYTLSKNSNDHQVLK